MNQYRVKFRFVSASGQLIPSEIVVGATDRTNAQRIVEAMYGGKLNIISILIEQHR